MVEEVVKPETGDAVKTLGNPFKYEGRQPLAYPPAQGAHTRAVLAEVCGYSEEKIDQLLASKAVFAGRQKD
jgi:crotonobetainyl-CoA:carnitine CoA-transferase CaiB-like acyl-CoA transferase